MISTSNNVRFAEGSVEGLGQMAGLGFFRPLVNLRLHIEGVAMPSSLVRMSSDPMVGNRVAGCLDASPRYLPLVQYPQAATSILTLQGDLDRARLEGIEDVRGGGHLPMRLNLYPEVIDQAGKTHTSML